MKHLVFDSPVRPDYRQQLARVGLLTTQRRDAVDGFNRRLELAGGPVAQRAFPRELEALTHAGEVRVVLVELGGADERADLKPAMRLVGGACRLTLGLRQPSLARGKCPRHPKHLRWRP